MEEEHLVLVLFGTLKPKCVSIRSSQFYGKLYSDKWKTYLIPYYIMYIMESKGFISVSSSIILILFIQNTLYVSANFFGLGMMFCQP